MNRRVNQILVALLITAMAAVLAFAKGKRENVKFSSDINVNGTLLKKGTYEVRLDEETGELSFVKGRRIVAKAMTRSEKVDEKPASFQFSSVGKAGVEELVSVVFAGTDQKLIIPRGGGQSTQTK